MAITLLLEELREIVAENMDEHPIATYICVALGSIILLILIYEVYIASVQAIYQLA